MTEVPILHLMEEALFDMEKENVDEGSIKNSQDFSELKVHKILYFLYGIYHSRYGKSDGELFEANFQAWRYGPVEINYRYSPEKFNIIIDKNKVQLMTILKNLMKFDVWDLVEHSHQTKPWIKAYNTGKMFAEISNENIHEYFDEVENNGN